MYDNTKQNSLVAKFDGIQIKDAATKNEKKLNIAGDDVKHCETVCQILSTTGGNNNEI